MKGLFCALMCMVTLGYARNSYTGGYSGSPGNLRCASSCHGGTSGTLVVSGFPTSYQPQQTYTVTVTHSGGSRIVNFNATTRVGSSTTVAGTFAAVSNTALYTGTDGGVYANPRVIDTAVFRWTAPAAGAGVVNFYCAGYQGTTSSANGQSRFITLSATEITTSVQGGETKPAGFDLAQNYPNPFNPGTTIAFTLPESGFTTLKVYDVSGREVATLLSEYLARGRNEVKFSATDVSGEAKLASGIYIYRLRSGTNVETKRMVLIR